MGYTLRDVAQFTTTTHGYIAEVERGLRDPTSEKLDSICSALGLDTNEILVLASLETRRDK